MEALPRTEMMAPELKDPEHPFPMAECNKIKQYIMMHYQNDPNNFNNAFTELDDMRSKMLQGIDEIELICVLKRYYAQLTMMKNRFPMELDGDAAVQFTWTERSSDNPLPIIIPDINFEICCVMFNIGSLHAMIAASQHRKDEDSSKTAFMNFQHAAWPFICLRDELNARRCGLVDFDDIALTFYANVMLAQAQECILEKSITEKRSPTIISKIAYRIFQLYNSCGTLISNPSFADMMSSSRYRNWTRLCSIKGAIYGVIYFHARGQDFNGEQKHGSALACFKAGLDLANEIMPLANKDKRTSFKETLTYVKDVIAQREQIARKENDLIYHERIPTLTELEEIKGVDMVKAISFKATDPSIAGEDLFRALLPSSVVEIVSLYEESKAELRRSVLNRCEKMDVDLETFLMTLKLDKLNLDQPGDIQRLPDELLSCYSEFKFQPDCVHTLLEKFHELTTKTSNVECQLADLSNRISAITTPQFATSKGYKAIANELTKLSDQHKQARSNNTELQKRLDAHTDNLKLFALSLPELTNEVGGKVIDTSKSQECQALRRLLDKVDEMRKQRIRLIGELRESLERDDITSHALADPHSDPTPIIKAQLTQHDKQIGVIDQNLAAQANILKALTEANANFADFRRQINDTIESKKTKAITLVTAFETFKQIRSNTDKAINFYDNMLKLLTRISEGIENMEKAKKLEDEEQRVIMEREQAKLQSLEVAEFVKEFAMPPGQSLQPSYSTHPNQSIQQGQHSYSPLPMSIQQPTSQSLRPKLGDFLRNKNRASVEIGTSSSIHNPTLPTSHPIHSADNYSNVSPNPLLASQQLNYSNVPQLNYSPINHPTTPASQQLSYSNVSQPQLNYSNVSQQQMSYSPVIHPTTPANQQLNYSNVNHSTTSASQSTSVPQFNQPQINPASNYSNGSHPTSQSQFNPASQPQMSYLNGSHPTSQPQFNPAVSYSNGSHPQQVPTSQFNPASQPQMNYSPVIQPNNQQNMAANQQNIATSQSQFNPANQPHINPVVSYSNGSHPQQVPTSQFNQPTSQQNMATNQQNMATSQPYSQPISTQNYGLPQNQIASQASYIQSNTTPNSSMSYQTPQNQQNQFINTSNGNAVSVQPAQTAQPAQTVQTAQSSLEELFGVPPKQIPSNNSNGFQQGQTFQQGQQRPQSNSGFESSNSPYNQQPMKPNSSSPWHNSSINPLLMNRNHKT